MERGLNLKPRAIRRGRPIHSATRPSVLLPTVLACTLNVLQVGSASLSGFSSNVACRIGETSFEDLQSQLSLLGPPLIRAHQTTLCKLYAF